MTDLFISILLGSMMIVMFKVLEHYSIHLYPAIIINYLTCFITGLFVISDFPTISYIWNHSALPFALLIGAMFISLFYLIGITAQKNGVAIASVSMRLGLIIPVLLGFFLYGEHLDGLKIIGIIFSLIAVFLINKKDNAKHSVKNIYLFLPFILIIGTGLADSLIQYIQKTYFYNSHVDWFLIVLFLTAFLLGFFVWIILYLQNKTTLRIKEWIGGIALGIPNYMGLHFLFKAFNNSGLSSILIFTLDSIGTVFISTFFSWLLFKEHISLMNMAGLCLVLIAIILLMF